jgi:uncharacterized protein YcgI (DUF1989 family)
MAFPRAEEFYQTLSARREKFEVIDRFIVEPYTGHGVIVKKGQAFRVVTVNRPQVADVGLWSIDNSRETVSAARTSILEGWFIRPYSRVWSDIPYLRPMVTCIADTVPVSDPGFHHHCVGTHCAPEWLELRGGPPGLPACRLGLLQAIEPFGLKDSDIRDNLNIHQKCRIDAEDGRTYGMPSEGQAGAYVEFYAEIDLLVAIASCPNGDNTRYWSLPEDNVCSPLRVEIYHTGQEPIPSPRWTDWRPSWTGKWERSMSGSS